MKNILVVVIIAYLAFITGGYCVKDEAIKYIDGNCNTVHIIETRNGHFYECKPLDKSKVSR